MGENNSTQKEQQGQKQKQSKTQKEQQEQEQDMDVSDNEDEETETEFDTDVSSTESDDDLERPEPGKKLAKARQRQPKTFLEFPLQDCELAKSMSEAKIDQFRQLFKEVAVGGRKLLNQLVQDPSKLPRDTKESIDAFEYLIHTLKAQYNQFAVNVKSQELGFFVEQLKYAGNESIKRQRDLGPVQSVLQFSYSEEKTKLRPAECPPAHCVPLSKQKKALANTRAASQSQLTKNPQASYQQQQRMPLSKKQKTSKQEPIKMTEFGIGTGAAMLGQCSQALGANGNTPQNGAQARNTGEGNQETGNTVDGNNQVEEQGDKNQTQDETAGYLSELQERMSGLYDKLMLGNKLPDFMIKQMLGPQDASREIQKATKKRGPVTAANPARRMKTKVKKQTGVGRTGAAGLVENGEIGWQLGPMRMVPQGSIGSTDLANGRKMQLPACEIPTQQQMPKYTQWQYLARNRYALDNKKQMFYRDKDGEPTKASDSEKEDEGKQDSMMYELAVNLLPCDQYVVRELTKLFGPVPGFSRLLGHFLLVEKRQVISIMNKLISAEEKKQPDDQSGKVPQLSLAQHFCRRCMTFNCNQHVLRGEVVKAYPNIRRPSSQPQACGPYCYKHIPYLPQVFAPLLISSRHTNYEKLSGTKYHAHQHSSQSSGTRQAASGVNGDSGLDQGSIDDQNQPQTSATPAGVNSSAANETLNPQHDTQAPTVADEPPTKQNTHASKHEPAGPSLNTTQPRQDESKASVPSKEEQSQSETAVPINEAPKSDLIELKGATALANKANKRHVGFMKLAIDNSAYDAAGVRHETYKQYLIKRIAEKRKECASASGGDAAAECGVLNGQDLIPPSDLCEGFEWTELDMANLKISIGIVNLDPCLLAKMVRGRACSEVALKMVEKYDLVKQWEPPKYKVKRASLSNKNTQQPCVKYWGWLNQDKKGVKRKAPDNDEEDSEQHQVHKSWHTYEPCNCGDICLKETCTCVKSGNFCEKYCSCNASCCNKFRGCKCRGKCNTKSCPCLAACRECDPDLCGRCMPEIDPDTNQVFTRCGNMRIRFQQRKRIAMGLSGTQGWGAFIREEAEKEEYLGEYTGDIITQDEADRRGKVYDREDLSYLFTMNMQHVLDARSSGNKLRFANHSTNPNCFAKIFIVDGDHRVGIFAKQNLARGEELYYDYRYDGTENCPSWARNKHNKGDDRRGNHASCKNVGPKPAGVGGSGKQKGKGKANQVANKGGAGDKSTKPGGKDDGAGTSANP